MSRPLECGFSFYGFLERPEDSTIVETPDGLRSERYLMVDELLSRGHAVLQLQSRRERKLYRCGLPELDHMHVDDSFDMPGRFPSLDLVFVEWRWKRLGKSTEDWDRQVELLDHYSRVGTPIVVLDTDLKVSEEDERRWPSMIICDPCVRPKELTHPRVRMPFCADLSKVGKAAEGSVHYRYVGNNYERDVQFMKYYSAPALALRTEGIQTTVHGNWLTPSPERMRPRGIVQAHRDVAFLPRLAFKDVHAALNDSVAVCHITKPEYARCGNVTMRYLEAVAAGVPALVPAECTPLHEIGECCGLLVSKSDDVVRKTLDLADMSAADRSSFVRAQAKALTGLMDFTPKHRVDLLEAAANGGLKT